MFFSRAACSIPRSCPFGKDTTSQFILPLFSTWKQLISFRSPRPPSQGKSSHLCHLLPLPWMLRLHGYPKPIFTHDEFWKLDAQQRDHLEQEVRRIPKKWAREPATELIRNYEAQQPPPCITCFLPCQLRLEHFGHLPIVGVVLGLRLLTKAYFFTALPALFVILVWCCWRWPSHWKRLILQSALGIGTAVAIGGVWYWRAHRKTLSAFEARASAWAFPFDETRPLR